MNSRIIWFLCISLATTGIIWRNPYFLWHDNTLFRIFILLSLLFFMIYIIANNYHINKIDLFIGICFIISLIYLSLPGVEGTFGLTFGYIAMVIFMMIPDNLKYKVFHYFAWIFAITLIPGIILMALFFVGFDFNYNIIESLSGRYYRQYFGAVALTSHISDISGFTRLHGMYNEPGVVGTFSALILIGDKFRIKNNPRNIIILIGGILSLSFAFMVMLLIYLFMRLNMKYIIVTILLLVVVSVLLPNNNEVIEKYVFDRFSIENGQLEGNNRITTFSTEQELSTFYSGELRYILFGMGNNAQSENGRMFGDSWQFFFYNHGIFGLLILLFGTIGYMAYKTKFNIYHCILLVIMFFLSFYQRHDIVNLYYIIVLFGGLANLQYLSYKIN